MNQSSTASDGNEMLLAQLACIKLARLVEGTVSIGLPAIQTRTPEPVGFLEERFRAMDAFALVLHTISWPSGQTREILRLREVSSNISSRLKEFQRRLDAVLDTTGTLREKLGHAQAAAADLLDAISEYARVVRLESDSLTKVKSIVIRVFDAVSSPLASPTFSTP
jgi:hypothetical protein